MKTYLISLVVVAASLTARGQNSTPAIPPETLAAMHGAPARDYGFEAALCERANNNALTVADWNYVMSRMPYVTGYEDYSRCSEWYFGAPDFVIAALSNALVYQPTLVPVSQQKLYLSRIRQRAHQNVPYASSWTQPLSSKAAQEMLDGLAAYGITP